MRALLFALILALLVHAHSARAADPYPGYTLFSAGNTAYLYDMNKQKVHEWKVAAGSVQTSTYLLSDGSWRKRAAGQPAPAPDYYR